MPGASIGLSEPPTRPCPCCQAFAVEAQDVVGNGCSLRRKMGGSCVADEDGRGLDICSAGRSAARACFAQRRVADLQLQQVPVYNLFLMLTSHSAAYISTIPVQRLQDSVCLHALTLVDTSDPRLIIHIHWFDRRCLGNRPCSAAELLTFAFPKLVHHASLKPFRGPLCVGNHGIVSGR